MKKLLAQIEVIDYYFSKVENYLGKKHQNLLQRGMTTDSNSMCSGSPKSTISDRQGGIMFDEDRHKDFEDGGDMGYDKGREDKEIGFTKVAEESNVRSQLTEKNILDL